jgi:NAD(P)-dependent dehydrogenase (short-subunit alcohol dehydrogenase family)
VSAQKTPRIVVTGPTSGVGREIAAQLTASGAEVVLACRDLERGRATAAELASDATAAEPMAMQVDTSSQESISTFARECERRFDRLDALVNNAGVVRPQRETSVDEIELTFATNVLGYHLVTRELLGMLRASAPARVVNVASTFASDLDLDDVQFEHRPYDGLVAYAQSKACDRMLTWALARRLAKNGVTANAMAPGLMTETSLYRDLSADIRHQLDRQPSRAVPVGAETATWLAAAPALEGVTGRFYELRRETPCEFRDESMEERLWEICEDLSAV